MLESKGEILYSSVSDKTGEGKEEIILPLKPISMKRKKCLRPEKKRKCFSCQKPRVLIWNCLIYKKKSGFTKKACLGAISESNLLVAKAFCFSNLVEAEYSKIPMECTKIQENRVNAKIDRKSITPEVHRTAKTLSIISISRQSIMAEFHASYS